MKQKVKNFHGSTIDLSNKERLQYSNMGKYFVAYSHTYTLLIIKLLIFTPEKTLNSRKAFTRNLFLYVWSMTESVFPTAITPGLYIG